MHIAVANFGLIHVAPGETPDAGSLFQSMTVEASPAPPDCHLIFPLKFDFRNIVGRSGSEDRRPDRVMRWC